jgi:cytochrome c5
MRHRPRLTLMRALTALLVAASTPVLAQTGGPLPQGEGRDLVAVACSQCHALAPLTAMREGQAGWRRHVHNMVLRGAQLRPSEAETVINYLTANFGPIPQGLGNVTLPEGPGKDLIEARCSACHDLERVALIKRSKRDWPAIVTNMVARGAAVAPDEVQAIVAYLATHFGADR